MKRCWPIAVVLALAFAPSMGAQTEGQPVTVAQAVDAWVTITETHLVAIAEAMPEQRYDFAPKAGEFEGVRTFGEQVKHLAANNYYQSAIILGQEPPEGAKTETGPASVKTKAEIIHYLKGSFGYLHRAVATIDSSSLENPIPGTSGTWQRNRAARVIDAIAHSFNHYGQLVEYLRMNGIIPPDSR